MRRNHQVSPPVAQKVKHLPTTREIQFNLWVGKVLWRRKWQPTPVLLSGKSMNGGSWQAAVHRVAKNRTCERLHSLYEEKRILVES